MRYFLSFFFFAFSISSTAQSLPITPVPVSYSLLNGPAVTLNAGDAISFDSVFRAQAVYLQEQLNRQTGMTLVLYGRHITTAAKIHLSLDAAMREAEGYQLTVKEGKILLRAPGVRGIVYGIQTLLQLLPLQQTGSAVLPAVEVYDYPRFGYRGMHLDVVRHFFPVSYIKKYIDYLSFHKFNTFHWHLTDDQGWRIEVLSYPKLNSIGSWRDSTLVGHFKDSPAVYEKARYGGFYTRDEIREVIAYATVRGIEIIPEIDVPGHSRATITAYPEFSTDPSNKWGVAYTWGMYNRQNNVLAPNPETFRFLRTIFHEVADLFPSTYIHLGGDECSKLWWKRSPETQAFIKSKGLKDEIALQTYFIEQVSQYLAEKGKKVIGWHEIMEGDLDTSTIVMNWSNEGKAIEAAQKGFQVIMTPGKPYYFDHYQSKDPKDSLAIHGYNSLQTVYQYEPVAEKLKQKGLSHKIIGGQGNVWTEYMEWTTKVDYMIFPRMTALSETLWSPAGKKNYADFVTRLKTSIIPRYQYWNSSWFRDFERWTADK